MTDLPTVSNEGGALSHRQVRRGLRINILAGLIGMGWVAAQGVPLTMLMEKLGATGVQIGLIVTTQQLAMLIQIPAAILSERLPTRKLLWASLALLHRLLWFTPALLPLLFPETPSVVIGPILVVTGVSALLAHAATASWFSWMADLVPAATAGRFWGFRQSVVMSGFLVATGAAGWALDAFEKAGHGEAGFGGFSIVFSVAALFGMADIIVHLWVPEPAPAPVRPEARVGERILKPLKSADFRRLTLAMGAWYFAVGLIGSFGIVYLKRTFGVNYTQLSLLSVSASLGTVVADVTLGTIIDRVGARAMAVLLLVVGPFLTLAWFFVAPSTVEIPLPGPGTLTLPQPVLLLLFVNFVAGSLYSGIGLCQINLAAALSPRTGRTMSMAVHWTFVGLLAALGPVAGGAVMDAFETRTVTWILPMGAPVAFFHVLVGLHMLVAWCACVPVVLRISLRGGDLPVSMAVTRLGNPLRAVGSVYNIYLMGAAVSSQHRARAARRLGRTRSSLAVRDLIETLDDPSHDVRSEAALALGRIATPESVDALIARIDDPDSDLGPQIARALRRSRDPRGVDVLLRKLEEGDTELKTASARALGDLGDRRATDPLVDLVRSTEDSRVLTASIQALSQLGEVAAVRALLPRMKATHNPVLKRSLAVAIGDLLGEPGTFYKLLVREEQTLGVEIERMIRDLRRALARLAPKELQEEVEHLGERTLELQETYENGDMERCAALMAELAEASRRCLTASQAPKTADGDESLVVGFWFLDMLSGPWEEASSGERDRTDILLGLFFLAGALSRRAAGEKRPASEPGP